MGNWSPDEVASRLARDLPDGWVVNLGIGMPTLVANHLPPDREIVLHSENGILGVGPPARGEDLDWDLIDAGKNPVTLMAGAAIFHHADSFAMVRGGHIDVAVLGAYAVSRAGDLANWSTRDPQNPPGVGGAMDLAFGARRVYVMSRHNLPDGRPKLVAECSLPLTAPRAVTRMYTDLAVIDFTSGAPVVVDLAPGVSPGTLQERTGTPLEFDLQPAVTVGGTPG